jgi:hypothetical protein
MKTIPELDYKSLYEEALLEIDLLMSSLMMKTNEIRMLEKVREIQVKHLVAREKRIKELEKDLKANKNEIENGTK